MLKRAILEATAPGVVFPLLKGNRHDYHARLILIVRPGSPD